MKLSASPSLKNEIYSENGSFWWEGRFTAKTFKPYINVTEGFLLEKNKNATIIYMSYNDTDIGDTCVIPSENIVELCELKK